VCDMVTLNEQNNTLEPGKNLAFSSFSTFDL
jgi:hypothetical protein